MSFKFLVWVYCIEGDFSYEEDEEQICEENN